MKIIDEELIFISRNIARIEQEYLPDEECSERGGRLLALLWQLPEQERRLLILYVETGTYRKVGELLGISGQTAYNRVEKIRRKLILMEKRRKERAYI